MRASFTKTHPKFLSAWLGLMTFWLSASSPSWAEDWPQWRGVRRDGTWNSTGVTKDFEADPPRVVWKQPIASGYSGPTVADGRVYVTDRLIEPGEIERVHCFEFATGKPLWSHGYPAVYGKIGYQAGPRASVTADGDRVYSLGTVGDLICLRASDGEVVFHRQLDKEYAISASGTEDRMPIWGLSASPLLVDDRLILQIGGRRGACVVALDKHTGEEIWRSLDDRAQYSAPILIEQAGRRVVVVWTGDGVVGLRWETGEPYWRVDMKPVKMPIGIATPIVHDDLLFVTSFYDGCLMLRLDASEPRVEELWRLRGRSERQTKGLHSIISTPIFLENHVYGVDSYGELRCLEAATGRRVWEDLTATPKARWSNIHFARGGDHIWMFNERGEMILANLTPAGFDERSRVKLLEPTTGQLARRQGVCWAHPAFARGHVLLRNDEELVSCDLRRREQ